MDSVQNDNATRGAPFEPSKFLPDMLGEYAAPGYELILLHTPDALDARGRKIGKAPIGSGWRLAPDLTVGEAREHMAAGGNVGVRLRDTDLVVDVDPRNFKEGDDPLKRLAEDLGIDISDYPTVITGGGGKHIYMTKPAEALLRDTVEAYEGIEFKSVGRQVVAAGSVHPETRTPYRWDDDPLAPTLNEARPAPDALIALAQRQMSPSGAQAGSRSPEELAKMLCGLEVIDYRQHDTWLELMMACHHATAGEARDEFIEWSTGDPAYSHHGDVIGRRWDSLHADTNGRRVTERTLFKALVAAKRYDLLPQACAADDFDDDVEEPRSNDTNPMTELVERMNERFCAVLEGGEFRIFMDDTDDVFDPPRAVWTRMKREGFRHFHENNRVQVPDKKGDPISIADIWLRHPKRRSYPGIVMDPEGRQPEKLNLWRGWAVAGRPGNWSLMRKLIDEVLCSGDEPSGEYVRRWIAYMLQHPGKPAETAIAFRGSEGTGKGTLGRTLMRVAGSHGLTVASPTQFAGRFNAHLRNVAFLFADEAFCPGGEAEGILKQLVTEPVISYEPKGKDIVPGRNLVHLMMASNEQWFIPAGMDARRFAVFDVADTVRNDREFFGKLHDQLDQGGLEGMVHELTRLDLEGWHPAQHVPRTEALAEQKLMGLEPPAKWWFEVLDRGHVGSFSQSEWEAGPITVSDERTFLLEEYDAFLKRNRIYDANATHKALVDAGKALGLSTAKANRGADRVWVLPPLQDARTAFEMRLGASGLFG